MRAWDLNGGAMKLEQALQFLQKSTVEVAEHWDDQSAHKFRETYFVPLVPMVKAALEAIDRLEQVLARAEYECADERS